MSEFLAIVATHPVQYFVPIYRELKAYAHFDFKVYYEQVPSAQIQGQEFGVSFKWDVDLKSGYDWTEGCSGQSELFDGIRRRKVSAVLLHGWSHPFYWKVLWYALARQIPVMVRSDSHLHTPRSESKRWLKKWIYPLFLKQFTACLSVGSWSKEYFIHYGVPPHRIFHVPHGIEWERFEKSDSQRLADREIFRKKYGLEPTSFVFIYSGRLIPLKGLDLWIQAIGELNMEGISVAGLIVGDGVQRQQLQKLTIQTQAVVHFTGFLNQTEITKAYHCAEALYLGSSSETWGVVVNEALACGLPCLVSDCVGCGPDLIQSGKTGEVFENGNLQSLKQMMKRMMKQYAEFSRDKVAFKKLLHHFSSKTAAMGIVDAFRQSIGQK